MASKKNHSKIVNLYDLTDEELVEELERRKRAAEKSFKNKRFSEFFVSESPVDLWKVTTEGDCEGRSTNTLGVYQGHIVDIALELSKHSFYSLYFEKAKTEDLRSEKGDSVSIVLDIKSGTWDFSREDRPGFVKQFLSKEKAEVEYGVEENCYYASVKIVKKGD